MIFVILQLISTLMVLLHFREDRGNAGCFWSRDPPRPPPRDHPVGYCMWVGNYYIIYKVNKTGGLGGVVEWGHETKNNQVLPRSSRQHKTSR